ncbi:hypothetical protein G6F57_002905 [Rhizopus arrhizus]|uniref:F-box domain-containing protein n=1 Tax=Rhizopus oryzae TaxID=64495 RepID=A0A9P6XFX4_RHIOR|nr:hypothetical protein G6F33_005174 [Rhizopus arrhizus]KAG1429174.1 hypothetical protein G6F58_000174 [Rhizopus delemar]KAG0946071.1 hypothetical protein G6F30_003934 [Rhizopus arrhizus]KAG0984947.1 hypothetical protein G6F29_004400 [Rhizopus arrhizus]KAG0996616.1 hypothetical protein G6F28_003672 [Rhizopus arrhizus]
MFQAKKDDIVTVRRDQYKHWCIHKKILTNIRPFPLPAEILSLILHHAADSQSTIHSASLVSKQWFYCATPLLYKSPRICDTYRWATFLLTLTRSSATFSYGNIVRSIDLSKQELCANKEKSTRTRRRLNGTNTFIDHKQHLTMDEHHSTITVSTSSLLQITQTCLHITSLNLSDTCLLDDKMILETGEYASTQRHTLGPGLTQIEIPIEEVIKAIGGGCKELRELEIRQTRWVTAQIIWLFAYYCPYLKRLDARRSPNCIARKLTTHELICSQHFTYQFEESSDSEDYFPFQTHPNNHNNETIGPDSINMLQSEEIPDDVHPDLIHSYIETEGLNHDVSFTVSLNSPTIEINNRSHPNTTWLAPVMTEEISPPSLNGHSIKDIVYAILIETRNTGANDLDWLDEYA